jgi:adenylate cyclase
MRRYHFKTIHARITVLLVLPVVFILLVAGVSGFVYARQRMLRQWNETAILRLKRAAYQIELRLSRPLELMKMFSQIGSDSQETDLLEAVVNRIKALPGVVRVNLSWRSRPADMDSESGMRMGMNGSMGGHRFMRFHRGAFARIAPPRIDEQLGKPTVSVTMVLMDVEGRAVGNLEIIVRFDYLMAEIAASPWWQNANACIVDKASGKIVFASSRMQGREKLGETGDPLERELLDDIDREPAGTIQGPGHPPKQVAGFHSLDTFPWALVVIADGRTILAPIIDFRNGFAFGAAALIVLVYTIIHMNTARISKTIRRFSQQAGMIAAGDYGEKIPVRSQDEIGRLASSFNTMIDGLKERDAIRNTFGRYVDPDFARALLRQPDAGRLGGKRQDVVILMADIRGFTPLAERLSPEDTIDVLNRYFSAIIPLIRQHKGIIVDFIGDAILAFFEPVDESLAATTQRCATCAFGMQAAMHRLAQEMEAQGLPSMRMGIGINSGPVVVGNIGSEARKKYGIVGAAVNITQRIQGQSDAGEVVVSQPVYDAIKPRVVVKRAFAPSLKGVAASMQLYALAPDEAHRIKTQRN